MKRPRGPGGRFLKKDELAAYYAQHPEADPSNPQNFPMDTNSNDDEDEDPAYSAPPPKAKRTVKSGD
jgi:protein involved in sex pheromone biosynthesis